MRPGGDCVRGGRGLSGQGRTRDARAAAAIVAEWEALAEATGAPPFVHPGWILAWSRAFARGRIQIAAVRDGRRLAAIVPLERVGGTLRSPTNWETPGFFGPVARNETDAARLARAVYERRPRRVEWQFVDAASPTPRLLVDAARSLGYRTIVRPQIRSFFVDTSGDWSAYLAGRSKGLRAGLARRRRRLAESGAVEVDVREGRDCLGEPLREAFELESKGWKGEGRSAIASRPDTTRFYTEMCAWAAAKGWLRLVFLRLDGRPLAFELSLEHREVHYGLKIGYDPEARRFAPGLELQLELLARAFLGPVRRFELLGDDAEWKRTWADRTRTHLTVHAFAPTPLGLVDWAAIEYGLPAARRMRTQWRSRSSAAADRTAAGTVRQ